MGENRRSLKILHVDSERAWGGGETQVMGLLEHLSLNGHQNHLLCHPEGVLSAEVRKAAIRALPFRMANELDPRPVLPLKRLIRRERYDIVHFHTKRSHALSFWLGRVHPGLRYVVTRRMDYPIRKGWYSDRLYNRQVDGVVAISRKIADLLIEGGIRKEKIRVIYSGIDIGRFLECGRERPDSAPLVVGTVAVLERRKGHRFLLEAARLLKEQGHRLRYRLAGEGTQRGYLEQEAARLGIEEEVTFTGFVSDVPAFLSGIDIFVLPSLYEGLGVAVIEAMAAGKPVVASRIGGLAEVVDDRVSGFLVLPGDSAGLARTISRLISAKSVRHRMGLEARERVRQRFSMEQMASENERFYYDLLRDRAQEPS